MLRTLVLVSSFSEYFGMGYSYELSGSRIERPYHEGNYIHNTLFEKFYMESPITIIMMSKPVFCVVEECAFFDCANGKDGGGIYYNVLNGSLIIARSCAQQCMAETGNGQFLFSSIRDDLKITIDTLSLYQCATDSQLEVIRFAPLYFFEGNVSITNLNVTKCIVHSYSGAHFRSNPFVSVSYSNFERNSAYYSSCLYKSEGSSNSFNISRCNLILNTSPTNGIITEISGLEVRIYNSVFLNNQNVLFYMGSFYLLQCYIYHPGSLNSGGVVSMSQVVSTSKYTETILLQRFNTYQCNEQYSGVSLLAEPCQTLYPPPTSCKFQSNNLEESFVIISDLFTMILHLLLID